jgi:hypothetical protein
MWVASWVLSQTQAGTSRSMAEAVGARISLTDLAWPDRRVTEGEEGGGFFGRGVPCLLCATRRRTQIPKRRAVRARCQMLGFACFGAPSLPPRRATMGDEKIREPPA